MPQRQLQTLARALAVVLCGAGLVAHADDGDGERRARPVSVSTPSGLQFHAGPSVTVSEATADDLFVASGNATVAKSAAADIYAAGGNVSVVSVTAANLMAAGGNLSATDLKVGDVIAAGGNVEIGGAIADDLIAAGGQLKLRAGTTVGGDAVMTGGEIDVAGDVAGALRATAGTVRLAGRVGGDATVMARRIELAPGTRIDGALRYRSRDELTIPEGVTVAGPVERLAPLRRMGEARERMVPRMIAAGIGLWIGAGLALVVLAAGALAAFPAAMGGAATQLARRPLASFGIGFALAAAGPVALAILGATLIGLPLAAVGGALYVAVCGLAAVIVCLWAGLTLRHRLGRPGAAAGYGQRLGWTALGALTVMIVLLVPVLGVLALLVGMTMAAGALALSIWGDASG